MQNFIFRNPTEILFGRGMIAEIWSRVPSGEPVLLLYGGGSIKRNGVYDQVKAALQNQGNLTDEDTIIYRVAGGMPYERLEEEIRLSGRGIARIMARDTLRSMPVQETSAKLDPEETLALFRQVSLGLHGLIPREQARFLPDSLVGSITIQFGAETATLFFLPNEEERLATGQIVAPQMNTALRRFAEIAHQHLKP